MCICAGYTVAGYMLYKLNIDGMYLTYMTFPMQLLSGCCNIPQNTLHQCAANTKQTKLKIWYCEF